MDTKHYNVAIIGGGASGTALLYTMAKYSNIESLALIEKYDQLGSVNSNGSNNSQSLHVGDIEMHYSREKAASVKPGAFMVPQYLKSLPNGDYSHIMKHVQKMALAVGDQEVEEMKMRFKEFDGLFPNQRMIESSEIAKVEPNIMKGRNPKEPVLALFDPKGHAVDYQKLSESFVEQSQSIAKDRVDVRLGTEVTSIIPKEKGYLVKTKKGELTADVVVVNADSYSLFFAKSLGYGEEFSLVPVGANFYYTPEVLKGKVYPMQDRKLPFAGVHGDPDLRKPNATRWGPTAKFLPVLESGKFSTTKDYFKSASLGRLKALKSFLSVMLDPVRFKYFLKSTSYDIPYFGKRLFLKSVKKIVPSLTPKDLKLAKGVGGMRLQRIDVRKNQLELGEGKIIGKNIIFNMTPSPGASVCLFNAMRDGSNIVDFFENGKYSFDESKMKEDLIDSQE